mgnify:FL=1
MRENRSVMHTSSLAESNNKVDLNKLMHKLKVEEEKSKRNNIIISVAAVSAVAVLGAALTF